MLEQFIEYSPYSIFPQAFFTERPDVVEANLFEGKIAIIAEGAPFVMTAPAVFFEFFQAIEDYTQRTIISSFTRLLRYFAVFIVITLPAIYITLIKFNPELIPFKFIGAIIESRKGIALTPFMSILSMNIIIDFLREGGLRLPFKIAQTLSVVGGIIIGDAAIRAKIVSSTTLLVVGVSTVATFLIPNYEMAISIRLINYPMLFLGNFLGMFGITIGWFFLITYLCTLKSYGVPYFKIYKSDLKDILVRMPVYKMKKRPEVIPNSNPTRQSNFRDLFRRKRMMNNKEDVLTESQLILMIMGGIIGVSVLSLPLAPIEVAKQDAWIATFLGMIYPIYVVFMTIYIRKKHPKEDILDLSRKIYGKILGNILNLIFLLFFF